MNSNTINLMTAAGSSDNGDSLMATSTTTTTIPRTPLSNKSNITTSQHTHWDHKDSSEGSPSPLNSIPDAFWVSSASDIAKSSPPLPQPFSATTTALGTTALPTTPPHLSPSSVDLNSESPLSRLETPFIYDYYGAEPLAPIIEQYQRRRRRRRRGSSRSTSDLSSLMHGAPPPPPPGTIRRPSHNTDTNKNTPQRPSQHNRRSFSLEDLLPIRPKTATETTGTRKDRKQKGEKPTPSSSSTRPATRQQQVVISTGDVHTYPHKPLFPPHRTPATPPGFAEEFMRRFGGERHHPYQPHHAVGGPVGRTSVPFPPSMLAQQQHQQPLWSGAEGLFGGGEFRGQRSGHGDMARHPFLRMRRANNDNHNNNNNNNNNDNNREGRGGSGGGRRVFRSSGGGRTSDPGSSSFFSTPGSGFIPRRGRAPEANDNNAAGGGRRDRRKNRGRRGGEEQQQQPAQAVLHPGPARDQQVHIISSASSPPSAPPLPPSTARRFRVRGSSSSSAATLATATTAHGDVAAQSQAEGRAPVASSRSQPQTQQHMQAQDSAIATETRPRLCASCHRLADEDWSLERTIFAPRRRASTLGDEGNADGERMRRGGD